jgi:hypothetical protein
MYYRIGSPKQLSDLKVIARPPIGTLRQKIPIVVVDDKGFVYLNVLRDHGFWITELRDVTDVKIIETYPIVVCDIRGVGKAFASQFEGAHVLAEIKKHYPNKILLAYTGQLFDATFNKYFALCDGSITKDAESQEWVEVLDNAIAAFLDPVLQWKKLRLYMIALDVPTIRLAELEHQYVSAVLAKQAPFRDEGKLLDLPQDAKNVLLGIASNYVFKFLTGQ